jgi:2,4-dienoyl-CoA reductase-like NADH-dependent reductase (Old Yellow Enzyme family)
LKDAGIDLIDVSSGGNIHDQKIALGPGYQVPFAEAIRPRHGDTHRPAVGPDHRCDQAEQILSLGQADAIVLAPPAPARPPTGHATRPASWDGRWRGPDQYARADIGPLGQIIGAGLPTRTP